MALANIEKSEVAALRQTVNELIDTDLAGARSTALEAVAMATVAEKEKKSLSAKAELGGALLSLCTVQTFADEFTEAVDNAKRARGLFKEALDEGGEGAAVAIMANVYKELITRSTDNPEAQKECFQNCLRNSREAVRLLKKGEPGVYNDALASALTNLAYASSVAQKFKEGLPAAKEAVDLCQELGDESGAALAMCYLADLHIIAGHNEDYARMGMFLNMATGHTAAAGYWAERALPLCQKYNLEDGLYHMKLILEMERVVKDAKFRNIPFDYSSWMDTATVK